MNHILRVIGTLFSVVCALVPLSAQAPQSVQGATPSPSEAMVTNPRAIEFDVPTQSVPITGYRLELFNRGSDTFAAQPVWVVMIRRRDEPGDGSGSIRIDLTRALEGVPNGEYIATLRAVSQSGESARSAPTDVFAVAGQGSRSASDRGLPAPPAPPPDPSNPAQNSTQPALPERRLWTIVGIAVGVAAIVGPIFVK